MTQEIAPPHVSRLARLSRRWGERHHYGHLRDWLLSLYSRLLAKPALHWLPGRGKVVGIYVPAGTSHPLYARLATTDFVVLDEIFIGGEYDGLLNGDLGPVRQVVDLGANIGFSVRLWQQRFPEAKVIAVEPDAQNLEVCRRNIEAGPAPGNVSLVRACIAAAARQVYLDRSGGEYAFTMCDRQAGGDAREAVQALPLPQVLRDLHAPPVIDLLKCDIEGAEAEVFADCRGWINRVRTIVIELHPPYTSEQFLGDMRRNGAEFSVQSCDTMPGGPTVMILRNLKPPGAD
jgi:FkbM family methyltransferase